LTLNGLYSLALDGFLYSWSPKVNDTVTENKQLAVSITLCGQVYPLALNGFYTAGHMRLFNIGHIRLFTIGHMWLFSSDPDRVDDRLYMPCNGFYLFNGLSQIDVFHLVNPHCGINSNKFEKISKKILVKSKKIFIYIYI
jgi:hypothetical protein